MYFISKFLARSKKRRTSGPRKRWRIKKSNKRKQNRAKREPFVIKKTRQWYRDILVRMNSFVVQLARTMLVLDESSDFSTSLLLQKRRREQKCGPSSFRKPEGDIPSIDVPLPRSIPPNTGNSIKWNDSTSIFHCGDHYV